MSESISNINSRPGTIILPVETLSREFDAKLHLGLRAVARGWRVVFGGRTAIHSALPSLPQSIYMAKGIRTGNRRIFKLLEQLGHVIVALDEESLIRQSDEAFFMMLDDATFNRPRLLYAWGKSNADAWRRFKDYHGKPILEAGNPRIDLLRPELSEYLAPDVNELRQRFGNYVLVSTNFSVINHYIPDHVRFRTAKGTDLERKEALKSGLVDHKRKIFEAFRELIPVLADAIAPVNLVIRFHPSENPTIWTAAAAGRKNVHVVHEGPMAPWLKAARALVQNGCTSAVEAAIVGTPALAFRPAISVDYEVELSNRVSVDCRTAKDLISAVQAILGGTSPPDDRLRAGQMALLRHHIASLDGPLSCERILDSLDTHADLLDAPQGNYLSRRLAGLAGHYRRRAVRAFTTRLHRSKSSSSYTSHKFPGFTEEMVASRIERFRRVFPQLPNVSRRWLTSDFFIMQRA
jgi:surface carbohydrate biosynthesis protein